MKKLAVYIFLVCYPTIAFAQQEIIFDCHVVETENKPIDPLIGDMDNDSKMEIVIGNLESSTISILSINEKGTFELKKTISCSEEPWGILLLDINNDGWLDIITKGGRINTFFNKGDLNFEEHSHAIGSIYHLLNFDVQGQSAATFLCMGYIPAPYDQNETFEESRNRESTYFIKTIGLNPLDGAPFVINSWESKDPCFEIEPRDYNNDRFMDFVMCPDDSGIVLMLQDAQGKFQKQKLINENFGLHLVIEDFNNDGLLDVILKDQHTNDMHYYESKDKPLSFEESKTLLSCDMRNLKSAVLTKNAPPFIIGRCYEDFSRLLILKYDKQKKTFVEHQSLACSDSQSYITVADVNGDGKNDIVAASYSKHKVSIYLQR